MLLSERASSKNLAQTSKNDLNNSIHLIKPSHVKEYAFSKKEKKNCMILTRPNKVEIKFFPN